MQDSVGKGTSGGMGIAAKSVRFEVCFAKRAENIFLSGKAPYLSIAVWRKTKLFLFWVVLQSCKDVKLLPKRRCNGG